ncbi:hypothetical protein PPSIR1_19149 [Plesiocystis pacifica SIR-1]|uniref:CHAT domain-containing protein n=1 Tax=Plesiocystis pacifica SIR-1 TaxID=391625 RepID=A6G7Z5_9BACT|nr:CHAT domain-containing protein [Plesiocystis pacifica]EDM77957.1 hypothetical protein PPSIR1_19149 [Plesiocystis pacifica SIR-1]
MSLARLVYDGANLRLFGPHGRDTAIPFDGERLEELCEYTTRYERATKRKDAAALVELGQALTQWLDGGGRAWSAIVDEAVAPLGFEISVPRRKRSDGRRALLMAPWEILADDVGHLALLPDVGLMVWRRLGVVSETTNAPPDVALSVLFMAADPTGQVRLDYEREEQAILSATKSLHLDLFVEETGTAREFGERLSRLQTPEQSVSVVHLSCHGLLGEEPALLLESTEGNPERCTARDLMQAAPELKRVPLAFVSACLTAQAGAGDVTSLAESLVSQGLAAGLGWAGSVYDSEATTFASKLYQRLAQGGRLEEAVGFARVELCKVRREAGKESAHWHLARLLLGAEGGVYWPEQMHRDGCGA